MSLITVQIIGGAVVVAVLLLMSLQSRWSEKIIQGWAKSNGHRLIESRNVFPFGGPFFWTKSSVQTVFRVLVYEGDGVTRTAWLLCGTRWGRYSPDDITVHWET